MNTTDPGLDLGLSYEELMAEDKENEDARWRRKDYHAPIIWEGDWDGVISLGSETYSNGTEHPRWVFLFKNCKFIKVSPTDLGRFTDGQDYALMMWPLDKSKKEVLQQYGKSKKVTGKVINGENFAGRVRVTEITENYMKNGYHEQSYHWKFERVGAAAAKSTEIPPELVNAALQVIAGGEYTEGNVGINLMKSPSCNTNAQLNGKFADGSFIKDMLNAGRLAKGTGDVLVVAG